MGITVTSRWKVVDQDSARKWGKISSAVWTKAGASNVRVYQVMTGPNVGNWVFALEFSNLGEFGQAREAVRATPEFREWTAEAAKVGNVMMDAGIFETVAL
jgi:hypothetical protein